MEMTIAYSEVATWLRCQKKWQYSYLESLVPLEPKKNMEVGTAGHKALEILLKGGTEEGARESVMKHLVEKMSEFDNPDVFSVDQATVLGRNVWGSAVQAFRALGEVEVLRVDGEPLVERPVYRSTPYPGVRVRGTADAVLRFPGGLALVVDHKFRKTFRTDLTEPLNLQMGVYQGLLLGAGVETHGSLQHQINPNPPSLPKINKDGKSVSRAACNTTPEIYLDQVKRVGGNPADYTDVVAGLKYKVSDTTCRAYRSPREVDHLWEKVVIPVVGDILNARSGGIVPRRCFVHEVCQSCEMRELCVEELKDGDTSYLRKSRYRHKDDPPPKFLPVVYEEDEYDE